MESSISDRRTVATRERGLHSLSAPTFENSASRSRMNFISNNEGNGYSRLNSPYNQELLRECYYNYLWHC
uniref:Uncharacterized protein n=1 Tax=Acrobeloides nanus TaxID=290746 RepID=A0A914EE49_9BILA